MEQYLRVDRQLIKDVSKCPKCRSSRYLVPTTDYVLNVGCAKCNVYFRVGVQ